MSPPSTPHRLTLSIPPIPLSTIIKIHTPTRCTHQRTPNPLFSSLVCLDDFFILPPTHTLYPLLHQTLISGHTPILERQMIYTQQLRVSKLEDYHMFLVASGLLMVRQTQEDTTRQDEAARIDREMVRSRLNREGMGGGVQRCMCGRVDVPSVLGEGSCSSTASPATTPPASPRLDEILGVFEQTMWKERERNIEEKGIVDLVLDQ